MGEEAAYTPYLKKASEEDSVPVVLLKSILDIESEKRFMKRRHNIYSELRNAIIKTVRERN